MEGGEKTRKMRNRGSAGDDGKDEKALSFLFFPGSSHSPYFPARTKKKKPEASAKERDVASLPWLYQLFLSQKNLIK